MSTWIQWDGDSFPTQKDDPSIYYAIGNVDIEDEEILRELANSIRVDGLTPTLRDAFELLETAIVTHGQIIEIEGERFPHFDEDGGNGEWTRNATWVEIDEYEG